MNFSNDPTLNYPPVQNPIQAENDDIARRLAELQRQRGINMQAQASSTPLWDEIDKIEDALTSSQKQYLLQNSEYVESLQYVTKLVQDEELRIIRPRVESTQTGQEALKNHLALMKKLRKSMAQAEEQKNAMLNDYLQNYSDMTWKEYLAKREGGGK